MKEYIVKGHYVHLFERSGSGKSLYNVIVEVLAEMAEEMKKYICKETLLNVVERNTTWNTNKAFEELIKGIPTVTKADICREFMEKVLTKVDKEELRYTLFLIMDSRVAEMEQECKRLETCL